MNSRKKYFNFIIAGFSACLLFVLPAAAQDSVVKIVRSLRLGETEIRISVHEKKGARLTFFAPHYNEQLGRSLARELIARRGGRLIEIESLDAGGSPARQIKFDFQGKSYSVDPNRIFTENGLRCLNFSPEISLELSRFAVELMKIVLAPAGDKLPAGEKFLVAVHNNGDVERRRVGDASAATSDLTAYAFSRYNRLFGSSAENFQAQVDGVYLSNLEADEDNFFFVSTPKFIGFFAERGFNVVLQKPAARLRSASCSIDDGSLSVYAGLRNLPYINVEADADSGSARQLQMLEAVYQLWQNSSENESVFSVATGKKENTGARGQ